MRLPNPAVPLVLCLLLVIPVESGPKRCRKRGGKGGKKCERRAPLRAGASTSITLDDETPSVPQVKRKSKKKTPPHWRNDQPPKDTLLIQREGSEAVFKCKAVGKPRLKIRWEKNGAAVKLKQNTKFRRSKKWKLEISKVTIGDSGNYTCQINNALGKLEWTYTLRVLENQPISEISILERPQNQTAHVGDTVVFMCRSDTWPAPSVHWAKKVDQKLVTEIIQMENNTLAEVLVLHNVSKLDAGQYTCYIGNDLYNLELSAQLTVIEEGEQLPFEPKCALHIRRQKLVDNTYGCETEEAVEMTYCMGSCGRSYFTPTMLTTDDTAMQANHLNQTCQCCVGVMSGIRIVPLKCPFGEMRRGFFTLLSECRCKSCSVDAWMPGQTEDTVSISP